VASFDKAISIKPDYAEAHSNRGIVLRKMGANEDAAESCRKAIAIKPNYTEAHNNLGNVLRALGQLD
jgi:Tfp pilus assembly protein PilF